MFYAAALRSRIVARHRLYVLTVPYALLRRVELGQLRRISGSGSRPASSRDVGAVASTRLAFPEPFSAGESGSARESVLRNSHDERIRRFVPRCRQMQLAGDVEVSLRKLRVVVASAAGASRLVDWARRPDVERSIQPVAEDFVARDSPAAGIGAAHDC